MKGYSIEHKGDWWWNREVQVKVEAKKAEYLKLMESQDQKGKRANTEWYKKAKRRRS